MKTSPPSPRSSAIGPLGTTSYAERSVTCLHCQKVHDRGFIWNFSDTVRVCFTCYRVMGDDERKCYERAAAKSKSETAEAQTTASKETSSKGARSSMKVMGLVTILIVILAVGAYFLYKPLAVEIAEHRALSGESRTPVHR